MPSGALGIWKSSQYQATPRPAIPNSLAATSVSPNLLAAPRRIYGAINQAFYKNNGLTITDAAFAAGDGTNDASRIQWAAGNNYLEVFPRPILPAGTYTLVVDLKSNTGASQNFQMNGALGTGGTSTIKTATTAFSRQSVTVTHTGGSAFVIPLWANNGTDAGDFIVRDVALYAGSADLEPAGTVFAGHLYLGANAYDTLPTYAAGAVDMSAAGAFGLIQLPTAANLTTFTAMALVSKVAAGSGYQAFLSQVQDFTKFAAILEERSGSANPQTVELPYFEGTTNNPAQDGAGLWGRQSPYTRGFHVITHRNDGTYNTIWLDDVLMFKAAGTVNFAAGDLFFGTLLGLALTMGDKVAMTAMYGRSLSDAEVRTAVTAMKATATVTSAANPVKLYCAEGDSISRSFSYSFPYTVGANLSLYGTVRAVSGSTLADLVSRATGTDAVLPADKTGRKFVLSVLVGANDLTTYAGGSDTIAANNYLTDLAAYCDARRAAGWKVVICTILPHTTAINSGVTDATNNTRRAIVNSSIRSSWVGVHADALADLGGDATMGADTAAVNTSLYADGYHPTSTGHTTYIVPLVQAAVAAL